jgi:hypothetical protein
MFFADIWRRKDIIEYFGPFYSNCEFNPGDFGPENNAEFECPETPTEPHKAMRKPSEKVMDIKGEVG